MERTKKSPVFLGRIKDGKIIEIKSPFDFDVMTFAQSMGEWKTLSADIVRACANEVTNYVYHLFDGKPHENAKRKFIIDRIGEAVGLRRGVDIALLSNSHRTTMIWRKNAWRNSLDWERYGQEVMKVIPQLREQFFDCLNNRLNKM